jgi:hypothetical protein
MMISGHLLISRSSLQRILQHVADDLILISLLIGNNMEALDIISQGVKWVMEEANMALRTSSTLDRHHPKRPSTPHTMDPRKWE